MIITSFVTNPWAFPISSAESIHLNPMGDTDVPDADAQVITEHPIFKAMVEEGKFAINPTAAQRRKLAAAESAHPSLSI